jgi:tRNA nucleotidyltransferase (CCA-adding enzyme)
MRIHNIDCDFVHLRGGEVYSHDSRIPKLKDTATPLDDALRRDFTVNSLFYNLRKRHVEDWTGRGISDLLQEQLLVTPLDASITFHDDPLRVLRAVRFAVRYNLTLSQEIRLAAMSPAVHESLHVKVSRERVGKELEGMLTGKNARPCVALKLITDLKLAGCVFEFPHDSTSSSYVVKGCLHGIAYGANSVTEEEKKYAREQSWEESAEMLQYCSLVLSSFADRLGAVTSSVKEKEECCDPKSGAKSDPVHVDFRMFYLSAFLHPLRNMICVDSKGKELPLPAVIVRDSIKFPNRDTAAITTVLKYVDEMRCILRSHVHGDNATFCRLKSGLLVRNLKELWITTLLVSCVAELQSIFPRNGNGTSTVDDKENMIATVVDKASYFYKDIMRHKLDQCWKVRPLLDGKSILNVLDLPRGRVVGIYLEEQMKWMLLNPDGTREECERHLKEIRKQELDSISASPVTSTANNVG